MNLFQTMGKMFMVDSVDLVLLTTVPEFAKVLAEISSFSDNFLEVEINIGRQCSDFVDPVAQRCSEGDKLLNRQGFSPFEIVRSISGHPRNNSSIALLVSNISILYMIGQATIGEFVGGVEQHLDFFSDMDSQSSVKLKSVSPDIGRLAPLKQLFRQIEDRTIHVMLKRTRSSFVQ